MSFFRLQVVSLKSLLFDGDVRSVYLRGDEGEFELLPYHYPLMAALPEGKIKIMDHDSIPIRSGVVMFNENRCTIICEEIEGQDMNRISWSGLTVLKESKDK